MIQELFQLVYIQSMVNISVYHTLRGTAVKF